MADYIPKKQKCPKCKKHTGLELIYGAPTEEDDLTTLSIKISLIWQATLYDICNCTDVVFIGKKSQVLTRPFFVR